MSKASSYLPLGFHALTVHLTVKGAAEYIQFLKQAFDGVELTRSALPDGRLRRAVRLTLYLPDADAGWAKALAAGCKVVSTLRDEFWGDRYGEVEDPFGFVWAIATHMEDLSPAEIETRRTQAFGGGRPPQA